MGKREISNHYSLLTTHWRRRHPGITLVELLVGFGVVSIITLTIAAIYVAHFRLFSNQNTSMDVATQNKLGLDEMTNEIRESQKIVNTCTNCAGDTTSATVLVLQLWPLNVSGEPTDPSGGYDYIIYKRDAAVNTKLLKKIISAASSTRASGQKYTATNVSDLQFTYDNGDPTLASQVTISLTTTGTNLGKTFTNTQTTKAVLRNK